MFQGRQPIYEGESLCERRKNNNLALSFGSYPRGFKKKYFKQPYRNSTIAIYLSPDLYLFRTLGILPLALFETFSSYLLHHT